MPVEQPVPEPTSPVPVVTQPQETDEEEEEVPAPTTTATTPAEVVTTTTAPPETTVAPQQCRLPLQPAGTTRSNSNPTFRSQFIFRCF